jgi:hypothetical protein
VIGEDRAEHFPSVGASSSLLLGAEMWVCSGGNAALALIGAYCCATATRYESTGPRRARAAASITPARQGPFTLGNRAADAYLWTMLKTFEFCHPHQVDQRAGRPGLVP